MNAKRKNGLAKGNASYTLSDDHGLATGVRESMDLLGCHDDVVEERMLRKLVNVTKIT